MLRAEGCEALVKRGRGSFGDVFLVRVLASGEQCAVKVVRAAGLAEKDAAALRQEAALGLHLRHSSLLPFLRVSHSPTHSYLFSPACQEDLSRCLARQGRIMDLGTRHDALHSWTSQLLGALAFLHQLRLAHRDVKAANLLLTQSQRLLLADLGCVLQMPDGVEQVAEVTGSMEVRAPELLGNLNHSPLKGDIWAAGKICYEMSEGRHPWPWQAFGRCAVRVRKAMEEGPPAFQHSSEPLRDLLRLALHPSPTERPTAEELLALPFFANAPGEEDSQGDSLASASHSISR